MRMRRIKVSGAAAAALVVTACGPTSSSSSGTPTGHPAAVSARPTSAATPATDKPILARLKRHINRCTGRVWPGITSGPQRVHPSSSQTRTWPGSSGTRGSRRAAGPEREVLGGGSRAGPRRARFRACGQRVARRGWRAGRGSARRGTHPAVLIELQRLSQAGFGLVERPGQLRHLGLSHQELGPVPARGSLRGPVPPPPPPAGWRRGTAAPGRAPSPGRPPASLGVEVADPANASASSVSRSAWSSRPCA